MRTTLSVRVGAIALMSALVVVARAFMTSSSLFADSSQMQSSSTCASPESACDETTVESLADDGAAPEPTVERGGVAATRTAEAPSFTGPGFASDSFPIDDSVALPCPCTPPPPVSFGP